MVDDNTGLHIVSPDGKQDVVISPRRWLNYGWSNDGASLYGIAATENRRLMLARIDVPSGRETTVADIGPLMASMNFAGFEGTFEYRGFSMYPNGKSFLTSVYRARMDIMLLRDFDKPARLMDWLWPRH